MQLARPDAVTDNGVIQNVSVNSTNSVTKIFAITVNGLEPATRPPLVLETRMLPQHQQDTCARLDLSIDPNSCFSDLSDSQVH